MLLLSIGFMFSASRRETSIVDDLVDGLVDGLVDVYYQTMQLVQTRTSHDEEIVVLVTALDSQFSDFVNVEFDDKEKMIREQYDEFISRINQMDVQPVTGAISEYENNMLPISANYSSLDDVEAKHSELSSSLDKLKKACDMLHTQRKELLKCCHYFKMAKFLYRMCQALDDPIDDFDGDISLEIEQFYFSDDEVSCDEHLINIFKEASEKACELVNMSGIIQDLLQKRYALIQDCILSTKTLN
ncbi:hypothetical protein ECANGB1_514 [Enterospora canceri]|uniref:Uncharacterized protein n=1 Tax=Enterospora canceri TaxID=1081671 RepID=A0A1Y1S4D6_9MICR|nr:hypothetical protein ECANGB1_514 [Enterospora canceri]